MFTDDGPYSTCSSAKYNALRARLSEKAVSSAFPSEETCVRLGLKIVLEAADEVVEADVAVAL